MNRNELVSIIIPVYNCEIYIEECINSLTEQTYNNIEIIAVNDGSKDNSSKIIERLAKNDKRIKLINKENGGVSSARNRGLSEAQGDFIVFCDADDTYYPEGIGDLMACLDNDTDFVVGSHNKEWIRTHSCQHDNAVLTKEALKKDYLTYSNYFHFIWGNLYRKDIIDNNNLVFDEELAFSEDIDFNLKYIKCCSGSLKVSDKIVYHYNISRSGEHEKRDYPAKELNSIYLFFDGKDNMDNDLYNEITARYLIRNVNRTMSWYGVKKTAEYVETAFGECKDYITEEILEDAFGSKQAENVLKGDYLTFTKTYFKEHKEYIYDKYRFALSKLAVKILKK